MEYEDAVSFDYFLPFLYFLLLLTMTTLPTSLKHLRCPHEIKAVIDGVADVRIIEFFIEIGCATEKLLLLSEDDLHDVVNNPILSFALNFTAFL
jgi:hypothetical protein